MVDLVEGRFLWRCDDCGWEYPLTPVRKHELPPMPRHNCPKAKEQSRLKGADEITFDDIGEK
jgi:rubredoxin